jgi:hypothetical protein
MKTWQGFAGNSGTATTRWNYDRYRGWLASKDHPDASTGQPPAQEGTGGPTYTYTDGGRLLTRVWKRGITTSYGYNNAGELASISYSDSTPGTTYGVDRRGRRIQVARNGITTAITFNDASQPLTESYTGGSPAGLPACAGHGRQGDELGLRHQPAAPVADRQERRHQAPGRDLRLRHRCGKGSVFPFLGVSHDTAEFAVARSASTGRDNRW